MKTPLDRGGLRFYLVILALLAGRATAFSVLVGAPLLLLGIVLHFWAKSRLEQNLTVTQSGPYRYVRHPFYVANGLVDAGILVMSNWWVLQVLAPVWWLGVYLPQIAKEERHLKELFGDAWTEYAARVPMLLPYRRPIAAKDERSRSPWANPSIAQGREIPRALRLLAYPFLFYVSSEVWRSGFGHLMDNRPFDFLMTVFGGMLYVLAWECERHIKLRKRILPEPLSRDGARAALAGLMLVACAFLTCLEVELDRILLPIGAALIVVAAVSGRVLVQHLVECMSLVGLAVMCEVPWLAPLPVLYYTALLMDCRLDGTTATLRPLRPCPVQPRLASAQRWLPGICIIVAIVKEVLID